MPSNSSRMRQRITLQRRTLGPDEYGDMGEPVWADEVVLAGSFEPLVGREFWSNSSIPQKDAQADARIRIWLRKGINPAEHRVVYGGIIYDIIAPPIYDRERRQTQLMVKARATGQPDGSTVNV